MALGAPGNIAWEFAGLNLCIELEIFLSARQYVLYCFCRFILSKLQRLSSKIMYFRVDEQQEATQLISPL